MIIGPRLAWWRTIWWLIMMIMEINNQAGRVGYKIKMSSWCPENPINSRIGGGMKRLIKSSPKNEFFSSTDGASPSSTIGQNPPNNAKVKVEKGAVWSENMTRSGKGLVISFDPGIKRQFLFSCKWPILGNMKFFHLNQWLLKYILQLWRKSGQISSHTKFQSW